MAKQNIFQKAGFLVKDFFAHWNTPPKEGYYLPNKEFVAYSVGGMGVQGMGILTQYFAINMGVHLAFVYNFDQRVVLWTTWIMAFLSLLRAPLVGWIMDNTNTKWGKYRPYLLYTGLLSVACFWLLAFIPNIFMPENGVHETETSKWLVIGSYQIIYFIAFTAFSFFSFGRIGLAQVITPNTNERTKLYSVGGVIDSLGPSIVQMFFPLIVNGVYGSNGIKYKDQFGGLSGDELKEAIVDMGLPANFGFGMENIRTYQIIFPIFGVICVSLALFMFFGTKERIIQEKKVKEKIGFLTGISKSFKNKYFWIVNTSNVLAFGRLLIFSATNYVCAYLMEPALGGTMRGIMPTIAAIGFVPGMAFSPLIQKKLGKKKMTLLSFAGSTVISTLMLLLVLFAFDSLVTPWIYFVGVFFHNIFMALWTVTSPAMTADYCEYQQWKTGDRLDGYMSQYTTVISTICGMLTGLLTSELLIKLGASSSTDYSDKTVLKSVFIFWGILGIVCGILAIIPFLFWDLSEEKQLAMAKDIKIRSYKEKLADNSLVQELYIIHI
ncbi:MAG: MFS transporter, partial [Clostridia bacterium]|nr:MFS transporter [Clostridia bacterium]